MHSDDLNVISVRLRPSPRSCGQLCFPKPKSLSVACVIGYSVCFIVACRGRCYQREQLGRVCQEDPVAVGVIYIYIYIYMEKKKVHLPSSLWTESMNSLALSKQCCSMFGRLICPCQYGEKSLFVLTLA